MGHSGLQLELCQVNMRVFLNELGRQLRRPAAYRIACSTSSPRRGSLALVTRVWQTSAASRLYLDLPPWSHQVFERAVAVERS